MLCRDRRRGDSRYPYGREGFTFWVHASGRMSANHGVFFWLLPSNPGHDPHVAAFAGIQREGDNSFRSHSLYPTPIVRGSEARIIDRYTVIGHHATYFFSETPELLGVVRVSLEQDEEGRATIYFSHYLENLLKRPLSTYMSTYIDPFCRHQFGATSEDLWFKEIATTDRGVDNDSSSEGLKDFVIRTNEDLNRFESVTNYSHVGRSVVIGSHEEKNAIHQEVKLVDAATDIPPASDFGRTIYAQQSTSWLDYVGSSRSSLASASFLSQGALQRCTSVTTFNDNSVVGDLMRFVLPANSWCRSDSAWSMAPATGDPSSSKRRTPTADRADGASARSLVAAQQDETASLVVEGDASAEINPENFNRFIPYLQRQVAVCAQMRGYMQSSPNSLIGFRDVMQAFEGHLIGDSEWVRAALLESLEYVLRDGRCPRQYLPSAAGKPAQADLREFVDQGAWAVTTVLAYVRKTGDIAFLEEQVGYHRMRAGEESTLFPDTLQDTVLDHLLRIVDYLIGQRDSESGLVCALYGDWNDAIDGLGVTSNPMASYGNGVSVMASLQLHQNCGEMIEMLGVSSRPDREPLVERHRIYREQLRNALLANAIVRRGNERRVLHGWGDLQSYYVGSFQDVDGKSRDGLVANAYWVLSGLLEADTSIKDDLLAAFDRLDSRYGLKTFEPGFREDASPVGRIAKLPIGSAENGAVYVHATMFAIAALFAMGEPERAWEQLAKVLPFSPHHREPSHSPFVIPNSYVDNPALNLTGQSMNDWQTGSSNVLWKVLVRYVAGFDPRMDHLRVAPASRSPFSKLSLDVRAHDRRIRITRVVGAVDRRTFMLNGAECLGASHDDVMGIPYETIPYASLQRDSLNEIVVIDPAVRGPRG